MKLLLFLLIIFEPIAYSKVIESKPDDVFFQIIKNKPDLDKNYALTLSRLINRAASKEKINKHIYTAILMQESKYDLTAKNCFKGFVREKNRINYRKLATVCVDFGISQINIKSIYRYKLDAKRLTSDLEYGILAGAKVLGDFHKSYGHREKNWWSRYNASNPIKRKTYEKLVRKYL